MPAAACACIPPGSYCTLTKSFPGAEFAGEGSSEEHTCKRVVFFFLNLLSWQAVTHLPAILHRSWGHFGGDPGSPGMELPGSDLYG